MGIDIAIMDVVSGIALVVGVIDRVVLITGVVFGSCQDKNPNGLVTKLYCACEEEVGESSVFTIWKVD